MATVDNPSGFVSTSAIQSEKRSYLFFSRPNGKLACLKSQTELETTDPKEAPPYKSANIIVDGQPVVANTKSPQIAAVSYRLKGQEETRVYYISDEDRLMELCRTNGGHWHTGSLDRSRKLASSKSLLTASVVFEGGGSLKLYYNRPDDKNIWVTWVTLGEQSWTDRTIYDTE